MNDNVNESALSALEDIQIVPSKRGTHLSMDRPDLHTVQRKRSIAGHVKNPTKKDRRRIVVKDPENQRIKQEFKFEALDSILTRHTD